MAIISGENGFTDKATVFVADDEPNKMEAGEFDLNEEPIILVDIDEPIKRVKVKRPAPSREAKTCTRCGLELSLDNFSKNPKGRLGRKSYCKKCDRETQKAHREATKERNAAIYRRSFKRCPTCERTLPIEEFWRDICRSDGRDRCCRSCRQERKFAKSRDKEVVRLISEITELTE